MSCNDTHRISLAGPSAFADFGNSVSISDSTIVVGAPFTDFQQGSVYIYYGCTSATSLSCNDANRVTLKGAATGTLFGWKVSVSGSTVVVGATNWINKNNAYMYYDCTSNTSTTCTDNKKVALAGPSHYVYAVSVNGRTVVVGAFQSNFEQGSVYIYSGCVSLSSTRCTNNNGIKLTGPSFYSGFGISVFVSGNTLVVGAYEFNNEQGAAYIYYLSGNQSTGIVDIYTYTLIIMERYA